ncbi:hypothetical protein [Cohnella thailandensis]|uniref:Uncharacterized protein n=1 Tax=Cohnella thailandensis TaxID=557557 RepID=A0A841T6Q4_9BACL|nr:hypothetical protein [Cohnella thailandensis]MBB6637537.1 hypothetical protein [Cohnella thailandensis]MBP1977570.1 hypothetical protein [Cohnella thailandensis]
MSQRYRITRSFQENNPEPIISLEECKRYFETKPDFAYSTSYTVTGNSSTMTIDGDFFLWSHGDAVIPFRHYDGDLYVAVSNEAVVPKMIEVASELQADLSEG